MVSEQLKKMLERELDEKLKELGRLCMPWLDKFISRLTKGDYFKNEAQFKEMVSISEKIERLQEESKV